MLGDDSDVTRRRTIPFNRRASTRIALPAPLVASAVSMRKMRDAAADLPVAGGEKIADRTSASSAIPVLSAARSRVTQRKRDRFAEIAGAAGGRCF